MSRQPDPAPPLVPDLLAPDLHLVFIGTAPSRRSAEAGAYYAHPGNRFWKTLHEAGFTPERYRPCDYPRLLDHGLGLTDLCKTRAGVDADLGREDFDIAGLNARLDRFDPAAIAFTSRTAAAIWLGAAPRIVQTGHLGRVRGRDVFVLPSTSGQAVRYWRLEPWAEAASWCTSRQGGISSAPCPPASA